MPNHAPTGRAADVALLVDRTCGRVRGRRRPVARWSTLGCRPARPQLDRLRRRRLARGGAARWPRPRHWTDCVRRVRTATYRHRPRLRDSPEFAPKTEPSRARPWFPTGAAELPSTE